MRPLPQSVLDNLRVLVVDDTADTREAFAMLLELEGAQVTAAADGAHAVTAAQAEPFDLLLSDIAMPGMDGYRLIRELRALEGPNANIAAIALTGFSRSEDVRRALAAGYDAHLSKPIAIDQLFELVERLLALRGEAERSEG